MKSFQEFRDTVLKEKIDPSFLRRPQIHRNPTKTSVTAHINNSDEKELRYVSDKKNVWVGDAARLSHDEVAEHAGVKGPMGSGWRGGLHMGFVAHKDISKVQEHPNGLQGWIADRHKKTKQFYISHMDSAD